MCGCGSTSSVAITRATSITATGEVLPSPNGSLIWFDCLTDSGVKIRKKPSRSTVGRTCTTGRPDQFSACSASQCNLCCGLAVVSVILICASVICDILMNAFTPWCFATAATLTVAARNCPMHRLKIQQIAGYYFRTHVSQRLRALVFLSHHRTHSLALPQQQFDNCASDRTYTTGCAGNQN